MGVVVWVPRRPWNFSRVIEGVENLRPVFSMSVLVGLHVMVPSLDRVLARSFLFDSSEGKKRHTNGACPFGETMPFLPIDVLMDEIFPLLSPPDLLHLSLV